MSWWSTRRERRRELDDAAVLGCIARGAVYGVDIWRRLNIGSARIYPALARLEERGIVVADWAEQPIGPPRRWYRLAAPPSTQTPETP